MKHILIDIIENKRISTVFQPIFNVQKQCVYGYEALTRGPEGSELFNPETLFNLATQLGMVSELEILCRNMAIKRFAQLNLGGKLFLNVSPMILLDPAHPQGKTVQMVENAGLDCSQIVIEISEKYPVPSCDILHQALAKYRQFGFEVAIDDLGAGYSGLKQWSVLRPEIVKIDRHFVDGCHNDVIKREFLRTMFELGRVTDALVIAEGIENKSEFDLLMSLGMTFAQGYWLAMPQSEPTADFPTCAHYHQKSRSKWTQNMAQLAV